MWVTSGSTSPEKGRLAAEHYQQINKLQLWTL